MSDPERHEGESAEEKAEKWAQRITNKFRKLWESIKRHRWKTAIATFVGLVVVIAGPAANLWRTVFPLVPGLVDAVKGLPVIWPEGKPLDLTELKQRALVAVVTKHRKEIESEKDLKPQYLLQLGNAERSLGNYSDAQRYYELGLKRAEERKNETNAFSKKLYRLFGMLRLADEQTDEKNEAAASFNLASLQLQATGELEKALKNLGTALKIHEKEGTRGDVANDLALLGEILSKQRKYLKAIPIFEQAKNMYQEEGEFGRVADMSSAIGEAYLGAKNLDSALTELKEANKQHEKNKDNKGLAKDLFLIGTVYRRQGKREFALEYFRRARKKFAEQHSNDEGKALFHMGRIYRDMGEPHQALDALKNSRPLLKDVELEARSNFHVGLILNEQGNSRTGLVLMQKALRTSRENNKSKLEARVLHHIGVTKMKMGRFYQALESFDQARSVHNRLDDKRGEARDLLQSGIVLRNMGNYYEAAGRFQAAVAMFRVAADGDEEVAQALGYLSLIFMDEGNYDQALRQGWKAYKISLKRSNWKGAADRMLDLALVYRAKGELDYAGDRVLEAQRVHREYQGDQDERWQARFYQCRGLIHKDRGELLEAYSDLRLAKELFQRKTGHLMDESEVRAELAVIGHELGESDRPPLLELQEALQSHREIGYPRGEATALAYMGRVLSDQGETAEALKCSRQALFILHNRLKDHRGVAATYQQIGMIELKCGNPTEADKSFRKACEIYKTKGDQGSEACSLACRGVVKFLSGDEEAARRFWQRGAELGKRAGRGLGQEFNLACLAGTKAMPGTLPEALNRLRETVRVKGIIPISDQHMELVRMIWKYRNSERKDFVEGDFCHEAHKLYDRVGDLSGLRDLAKILHMHCSSDFSSF